MSNYFDNQDKWSWQVSDKEVLVTTDHGNHTHTMDITNVPIGELADHTGQVMGDAHRAASHDFKEESEMENINMEDNAIENNVAEDIQAENTVEDDGLDSGQDCDDGLDGGEDCDDGLDI